MDLPDKESQVILACQAIQKIPKLSVREAARIYMVDRGTVTKRLRGITARRDTIANSRILTNLEESTIVEYILDLDSRSFPPRPSSIRDIANRLLADCDAPSIGL
jgi:hypothetical protein